VAAGHGHFVHSGPLQSTAGRSHRIAFALEAAFGLVAEGQWLSAAFGSQNLGHIGIVAFDFPI
jgi:hypothetical protein